MSMPSFGYAIANAFQRPVHYFSKQHFIAIKLKLNVPIPPIMNGWEDICSEQSKLWKNLFVERIARFKKGYEEERNYLQKENLE
ncbi:hypothetical protein C2G38_2197131 [Gigaspora rosea]|uniref:Uncharacterized protein n=1 Tax=Gigaspora rosea TaxID=44941 RepID=A0A397UVS3_9GLOM|nr:hypothetical protein C2G38_2197131 [Gigaspora rosea]